MFGKEPSHRVITGVIKYHDQEQLVAVGCVIWLLPSTLLISEGSQDRNSNEAGT